MTIRSSALFRLSVLCMAACTAAPLPAPSPPVKAVAYRIELEVEQADRAGEPIYVDIGTRPAGKSIVAITRPDHVPDAYYVALFVGGDPEALEVSSDVVPFAKNAAPGDDRFVRALFRDAPPPGRPPAPDAPPLHEQRLAKGTWSELAGGAWPDGPSYRVLARVTPVTSPPASRAAPLDR
jgi:hypothetical protein